MRIIPKIENEELKNIHKLAKDDEEELEKLQKKVKQISYLLKNRERLEHKTSEKMMKAMENWNATSNPNYLKWWKLWKIANKHYTINELDTFHYTEALARHTREINVLKKKIEFVYGIQL